MTMHNGTAGRTAAGARKRAGGEGCSKPARLYHTGPVAIRAQRGVQGGVQGPIRGRLTAPAPCKTGRPWQW